jgi:hypothetical protein
MVTNRWMICIQPSTNGDSDEDGSCGTGCPTGGKGIAVGPANGGIPGLSCMIRGSNHVAGGVA